MVGAIILTKTHNNINTTFIRFSFSTIILPQIELEYFLHFTFLLAIILFFYFIFIRELNIKLPKGIINHTVIFAGSTNPLHVIYANPEKEYCRLLKEQSNIKERIADLTLSIHQADYLL